MYNARADSAVNARKVAAMVKQCVYQRAGIVARSRMHHHAARLVKHYHIVIFINYIQRNVFRYGFNRLRFGNIHHKHFAGTYFVIV